MVSRDYIRAAGIRGGFGAQQLGQAGMYGVGRDLDPKWLGLPYVSIGGSQVPLWWLIAGGALAAWLVLR